LVEETGVPEKKTTDKSLTIYDHIILHQVHLALAGFELTTLVVIGIDCIGSYKSNNHTNTATTVPQCKRYFPHNQCKILIR
jgi:hypothetical protein